MDQDEQAAARDVAAAATVHAALREIDNAIADLAASPLSEDAADRMRAVLASPRLRQARRTVLRMTSAQRGRGIAVVDGRSTRPVRDLTIAGGAA